MLTFASATEEGQGADEDRSPQFLAWAVMLRRSQETNCGPYDPYPSKLRYLPLHFKQVLHSPAVCSMEVTAIVLQGRYRLSELP